MKVHLLAIVGGSGSGKTWLAERILTEFQGLAGRLSLDDFYRDLSHLTLREREHVNFDHPDSIDWELFLASLTRILQGVAVDLPDYDFSTHTPRPLQKLWSPCPLVVLDGLWLLHRPELRALYRLRVFVDCPEGLRLERRLDRDQRERGRSAGSVRRQFQQHVAPMHNRYVAPQAALADVIMDSPASDSGVEKIFQRCRALLRQR